MEPSVTRAPVFRPTATAGLYQATMPNGHLVRIGEISEAVVAGTTGIEYSSDGGSNWVGSWHEVNKHHNHSGSNFFFRTSTSAFNVCSDDGGTTTFSIDTTNRKVYVNGSLSFDTNNNSPIIKVNGTTALQLRVNADNAYASLNILNLVAAGSVSAVGVAVGGALTTATTGAFSGAVTVGGSLTAVGVAVGGALTTASTGAFSGAVTVGGTLTAATVVAPNLDRTNGQTGIIAPTDPGWGVQAVAIVANDGRFVRFVPSKDMTITKIAFVVTTAAGSDDAIDVGIYDSTLGTRIVSSGATTGKLNATGVQTVTVASTPLTAGTVYYAAYSCGAIGTSAASVSLANWPTSANETQLNGSTVGKVVLLQKSASHPLPTSISSPSAQRQAAMMSIRES